MYYCVLLFFGYLFVLLFIECFNFVFFFVEFGISSYYFFLVDKEKEVLGKFYVYDFLV